MSSSSQVLQCQTIAKQALENVVSLGTRLYGYQINSRDSQLQYNPLFIKKDPAKNYGGAGNIKDVGDGSALNFPPQKYKTLFQDLLGTTSSSVNPKDHTGVPIITSDTNPIEIAPGAMLINSVNALQYLYNSDPEYFKGNPEPDNSNEPMGKDWTVDSSMSNDRIPDLWKKYKEQFKLNNVKFYVRIAPVDLKDNNKVLKTYADINAVDGTDDICKKTRYNGSSFVTSSYSCPVHASDSNHKLILTRSRLINPDNASLRRFITPDLTIVGNENIGFEIKVMLKYERNGQDFSCDAMHTFAHSTKSFTGTMTNNASVTVGSLVSGAGTDLLDASKKKTSCDTHGSGYKNVTTQLNFSGFSNASLLVGNMFFCQGVSACRSGDDNRGYESCQVEVSPWQRCHNFKFPGQTGTTDALVLADDQLNLTFNNLRDNRRYDLYFTEVSFLETPLKRRIARFYVDAKRPVVRSRNIKNDNVGTPTDGIGGRSYSGPTTNWSKPSGSADRKWLQCNTGDVDFFANVTDQFIHNLEECDFKGDRRDGNGTSDITRSITNKSYRLEHYGLSCSATLSSIAHGRQTIKIKPSDICDFGTEKKIIWDTDLPSTFTTYDFSSDPFWFYNTSKTAYPINTVLPATSGAGRFPKHYSVDCFENQICLQTRQDGNGGTIACKFTTHDNSSDHDGCNPRDVDVKYYHVCGGTGDEDSKWSVYAPRTESCKNVQCEPALICCDGDRGAGQTGECGSVNKHECESNSYSRSCTNPKGGGNSYQDNASGCPPLGLYSCSYQLPCNATSPCSERGPTSACTGKRQGNSCSYSKSGSCIPNSSSWSSSCNPAGTYRIGCDSGSCTAGCTRRCAQPCTHTCYDTCTSCTGTGKSRTCTSYSCRPHRCHSCDRYEHRAVSRSMSIGFSGTCGVPSGGCSRKGVGGGNLSQERCSVDRPSACGTPCDSSTTCCSGDSYPSNSNCPCDSNTACCPGDSYPSNSHCTCNSSTTCCPGNSYPANPLCTCDSSTTCCKEDGDTYLTNPAHCVCDRSKECCPGDTPGTNSNCTNDGKCDTSRRGGCKQPSGGSQSLTDSATHHRWKCLGINGGADAICEIPIDPIPQCKQDSNGNDIPYECDSGTSKGQNRRTTADGIEDKWKCVNSNGDKKECSIVEPLPITSCTCNNLVADGCGHGCTASQPPNDTATHDQWICKRSGYQDSETCSIEKRCICDNTQVDSCGDGCTASQPPNDTTTHDQWVCKKSGYQDSGTCSKPKNGQDGRCGGTRVGTDSDLDIQPCNNCDAGDLGDYTPNPVPTDLYCSWKCVGSNGGITDYCVVVVRRPIQDWCECGSSLNDCDKGDLLDVDDTDTEYRWQCIADGSECGKTVLCKESNLYSTCGIKCGVCENDNGDTKEVGYHCGNKNGTCLPSDECFWICEDNNSCDATAIAGDHEDTVAP